MKRFFDCLASGCGLILLSPLLCLVAALVKLTSAGPIFFRQERVGRGGNPFRIFKFRTMAADSHRQGRNITVKGDCRITRLGRILRHTKIDELPQLINVLCGEMSLVGPRPEVPEYVDMFWHEFESILKIRPGITHRASILFRNEEELLDRSDDPERFYIERVMPRKLQLYAQDLDQESLRDDVRTILDTIFKVGKQEAEEPATASILEDLFLMPVMTEGKDVVELEHVHS
ncbi:MAG: sugar transferase [bacterium]